jgi:hypothetical protein
MRLRIPLNCRVCGLRFTPKRFDALTCSSTCRQRLHRGGDGAFLAALPRDERADKRRWLKLCAKNRTLLRIAYANQRSERATKRGQLRDAVAREVIRDWLALPDDAFESLIAALREVRAKMAADAADVSGNPETLNPET